MGELTLTILLLLDDDVGVIGATVDVDVFCCKCNGDNEVDDGDEDVELFKQLLLLFNIRDDAEEDDDEADDDDDDDYC